MKPLFSIAFIFLSIFVAVFVVRSDPALTRKFALAVSTAAPVVSDLQARPEVRMVNNEPDYGYLVLCKVRNTGHRGSVKVVVWLTCSEGNWDRSQELDLDADESMDLSYFFQEPTINSTNVQYGVRTVP